MSMQESRAQNAGTMIAVVVNGHARELPAGSTITDLLCSLNVTTPYVVVQLDGTLVPRTEHAGTGLRDGNRLEVITLVGGG